MDNVDLYSALS